MSYVCMFSMAVLCIAGYREVHVVKQSIHQVSDPSSYTEQHMLAFNICC